MSIFSVSVSKGRTHRKHENTKTAMTFVLLALMRRVRERSLDGVQSRV